MAHVGPAVALARLRFGGGGGIFHFKFERKRKVRRPLFPPKKFVIEKLLDLETLENVFIRVLRFGLFFFWGGGEEAWGVVGRRLGRGGNMPFARKNVNKHKELIAPDLPRQFPARQTRHVCIALKKKGRGRCLACQPVRQMAINGYSHSCAYSSRPWTQNVAGHSFVQELLNAFGHFLHLFIVEWVGAGLLRLPRWRNESWRGSFIDKCLLLFKEFFFFILRLPKYALIGAELISMRSFSAFSFAFVVMVRFASLDDPFSHSPWN